MKKPLSLLIALLLALSTLLGCADLFSTSNGPTASDAGTVCGSQTPNSTDDEDEPESTPSDDGANPDEESDTGAAQSPPVTQPNEEFIANLGNLPEFDGKTPYIKINGNKPYFEESEMRSVSFESYSNLDRLGRCGVAFASVGIDVMPTEDRESISSVTPTGWKNKSYSIVSGGYLYNRSHLIGFQLTAENANKKNLITGTRFMNFEGMLPFENMVADYVKETENHVMYRITPIFEGNNLLASGVLMEAYSVEDDGRGICFCVYVYNAQPGIYIDYATGDNRLADDAQAPELGENDEEKDDTGSVQGYILNTATKKFHRADCSFAPDADSENRGTTSAPREDLIKAGYSPCGKCDP